MRPLNPLSVPLAVLAAAVVLVGLRLAGLSPWVAIPLGVLAAWVFAPLLAKRRGGVNPALERELEAARTRARELAQKADGLYTEAFGLLAAPAQVEALGIVQHACNRVRDLPARVEQLSARLQGEDSLLCAEELEAQLREVERRAEGRRGAAREQLDGLSVSLRRNIGLAREGRDVRLGQVAALATLILDTAGALQAIQNRLRTADLPQLDDLRSLDEQLSALAQNVELLVAEPEPATQLQPKQERRTFLVSAAIAGAALALSFAPLPGPKRTLIVVSGTELAEPLQALKAAFERERPDIALELKFQGSQDIVNRFIDEKNTFTPAVLIPANGEVLEELAERRRAQGGEEVFYEPPRPVAKTVLVAIAWPERARVLFPDGRFGWDRLERALAAKSWAQLGAPAAWGSFDFAMSDPTRSSSGQLTLALFAADKTAIGPGSAAVQERVALLRRSVYQPPRSTDVLLQEFIARGPNDADVATVYESVALYRWEQSAANQGKPYGIFYLDPTFETVSTAAIVRRDVDSGAAEAARTFVDFLVQPKQQAVFVRHGFRPVAGNLDVGSVDGSPWRQGIPGAQSRLQARVLPPPNSAVLAELRRLWERAQ
ncbi:substrate-binding domain-containing protein [Gloeobacter violaceus]|uniref:Gll3456 protein n=1 Tax=Gloeobacter violaceus (strain ATCC 29082 / PCC 7421) TaxID=251221 RepID=Q7NFR8_GLOVI|nr:substrate-binding domain-containing protein [Gloeobacter violaceus]BAC91397.1 gll3456 [Gloeobacter violaceus PCC 7421]